MTWSAGILLASPDVGIGKTHLAIAAAREGVRVFSRLIELTGAPLLMQGEDYRLGGTTK